MKRCPDCGFRTKVPEKYCPLCGVRMRNDPQGNQVVMPTHVHGAGETCGAPRARSYEQKTFIPPTPSERPTQRSRVRTDREFVRSRKKNADTKKNNLLLGVCVLILWTLFRACVG